MDADLTQKRVNTGEATRRDDQVAWYLGLTVVGEPHQTDDSLAILSV